MSRNNFCTFCSPKQHVISETSVCVLVSVPLTSCSDPEKYAVELPCLSPLSSQEDGVWYILCGFHCVSPSIKAARNCLQAALVIHAYKKGLCQCVILPLSK